MTAPIPPQPGSLTATRRAKLSPEMQAACAAIDGLLTPDWPPATSPDVEDWRCGYCDGVRAALGVIERAAK